MNDIKIKPTDTYNTENPSVMNMKQEAKRQFYENFFFEGSTAVFKQPSIRQKTKKPLTRYLPRRFYIDVKKAKTAIGRSRK